MADLPDYYTQAQISEAEAASFKGGLAANRSDDPVSRDIYYGTDNKILYVCVVDGTWININALYLLLAGGTMTGAIAMGANKITGLADPAANQDAATRAYVLAQKALCLLLTGGTMSGNIAMGANKLTGLGAGTVPGDSLRYEQLVQPTKEFFVPAYYSANLSIRGVLINAAGKHAWLFLLIPQDFTAITNIEVIFDIVETGADMHFNFITYYGTYNGGEDYNVHTETGTNRDIGATVADQNLAHSIADLVDISPLAAGDLLLIDVGHSALAVDSNGYVVGLRLKYT